MRGFLLTLSILVAGTAFGAPCAKILANLSASDKEIIWDYTSDNFTLYNSFLRTGKIPYRWRTLSKTREKIDALKKTLEKIPQSEASLYRYVDIGRYKKTVQWNRLTFIDIDAIEVFLRSFETSGIYSDPGFFSTTLNDIPSGKFVFTTIQFRIQSKKGRPISGTINDEGPYPENEFLFLPGTRFRIKKIYGEFVQMWPTNVSFDAYPSVDQWIKYVEQFQNYFPNVTTEMVNRKFKKDWVPNIVVELEDI